jgi:signal transduction histidine kinase
MMARVPRTVRMRLTALYSVLFVVSAFVLLAITNGVGSTSSSAGAVGARGPARLAEVHDSASRYIVGSLIALAIMAVASVVVGWLAAGRILRPLRAMTVATRRISADSLHERLAMTGPGDELKDLSDTIDELLGRLDGAFTAQRRFVANASHELRTPLTTIRAIVDVAVAKPGPVPDQTVELAGRVRSQLDKVDELLEALLALARARHGALPEQVTLSLEPVVSAALAARAGEIAARNLTVQQVDGPDGAWVQASQPLLCRMIDNVLDNAISHNRDGGWIRVATGADGAWARLVVENGGAVLDPEQVAGLGQPFRRLAADRTGSDDGAGLGLSIVAAIAEAHDGTFDLRARAGGGLEVVIALPRVPS